MADDEVAPATSPSGATSPPEGARIDALLRRVDEMEAQVRRLEHRLGASAAAAPPVSDPPRPAPPGIARPSEPVLHMELHSYLALTSTQVDELMMRRDVALHDGDADAVRALDERASGLICVALTRASDDIELPDDMTIGPEHMHYLRREPVDTHDAGRLSVDQFREREIALLRLIGMSNDLARTHVDQSLRMVRSKDVAIRNEQDLHRAVRDAAAGACRVHDTILASRRTEERTHRRRLVLKRWAVALGGVTIVAADAAGDALGASGFLTAASATLGAGAAGAVANLIED